MEMCWSHYIHASKTLLHQLAPRLFEKTYFSRYIQLYVNFCLCTTDTRERGSERCCLWGGQSSKGGGETQWRKRTSCLTRWGGGCWWRYKLFLLFSPLALCLFLITYTIYTKLHMHQCCGVLKSRDFLSLYANAFYYVEAWKNAWTFCASAIVCSWKGLTAGRISEGFSKAVWLYIECERIYMEPVRDCWLIALQNCIVKFPLPYTNTNDTC